MLELVIDNTSVPMDETTTITITATNPALASESTGKVYSYPFKLPWSPHLLSLFQHVRRLDATGTAQSRTAFIKMAHFILFKGFVKTLDNNNKSNSKSLDLYFKADDSAILKKLDDFKLSAVCPKIDIPQPIERGFKYKIILTPSVGFSYFLSINDIGFLYVAVSGDTKLSVCQNLVALINAQIPNVAAVYNPFNSDVGIWIMPNDNFSPKLYHSGPNIEGFELLYHKTYGEAQHDNFITFVKETFNTPRADISFNRYINSGFYAGKNTAFYTNEFNFAFQDSNEPLGWNVPGNQAREDENFTRSFIPFYRLSYLFQRIAERIGLTGFTVNSWDLFWWNDVLKLLIESPTALDYVRKDYYEQTEQSLNCFVRTIDSINHLPDQTAKAFLDDFSYHLNLDYKVVGNQLVFSRKNRLFTQTTAIVDTLIEGYERGYKANKGYRLTFKVNEAEKLTHVTQLQPRVVGEASDRIELPFGTLYNTNFNVVETQTEGNKPPSVKRLFFDSGIIGQYLCSSHEADNLSLDINHPTKGIYALFWQNSAELQAAGYPLSIEMMTSPQALHRLLTFEQSKIYLLTDTGNVVAYIKEISAKISVPSAKLVRVKMELVVG